MQTSVNVRKIVRIANIALKRGSKMDKLYKLEEKVYECMTNATTEISDTNTVRDIYVDDGLRGVGIELARAVIAIFEFTVLEGIDLTKCVTLIKDWETAQLEKKARI
jgi:hypothetical protein